MFIDLDGSFFKLPDYYRVLTKQLNTVAGLKLANHFIYLIRNHANNNGSSGLFKVSKFAEESKLHPDSIRKGLKELEKVGLIILVNEGNKGKRVFLNTKENKQLTTQLLATQNLGSQKLATQKTDSILPKKPIATTQKLGSSTLDETSANTKSQAESEKVNRYTLIDKDINRYKTNNKKETSDSEKLYLNFGKHEVNFRQVDKLINKLGLEKVKKWCQVVESDEVIYYLRENAKAKGKPFNLYSYIFAFYNNSDGLPPDFLIQKAGIKLAESVDPLLEQSEKRKELHDYFGVTKPSPIAKKLQLYKKLITLAVNLELVDFKSKVNQFILKGEIKADIEQLFKHYGKGIFHYDGFKEFKYRGDESEIINIIVEDLEGQL